MGRSWFGAAGRGATRRGCLASDLFGGKKGEDQDNVALEPEPRRVIKGVLGKSRRQRVNEGQRGFSLWEVKKKTTRKLTKVQGGLTTYNPPISWV